MILFPFYLWFFPSSSLGELPKTVKRSIIVSYFSYLSVLTLSYTLTWKEDEHGKINDHVHYYDWRWQILWDAVKSFNKSFSISIWKKIVYIPELFLLSISSWWAPKTCCPLLLTTLKRDKEKTWLGPVTKALIPQKTHERLIGNT